MIHRMSDEHKIGFLEDKKDKIAKSAPKEEKKESIKDLAEAMKSKKLSNKDDGLMTTHHIRSARAGRITNTGGPDTVSSTEALNSIWDSNKLERSAKQMDSKTRVKQEKDRIVTNRRMAEQKRMDELVENLKDTEQRKDSTVSRASDLSGSNYYSPKSGMSIFDNKEFERLENKTGGEKVSEETKIRNAQKDNSWKNDGKSVSSKKLQNLFMDRFFDNQNGD